MDEYDRKKNTITKLLKLLGSDDEKKAESIINSIEKYCRIILEITLKENE